MTSIKPIYLFIAFRTCTMKEKYYNPEKIRLWDFHILMRSEVSCKLRLCYFSGDLYVYASMWINTIASKRWIWLSSNLMHSLQVTIERILLILMNFGFIVFSFTGLQKRILKNYGLWSQTLKSSLVSEWWIRLSSDWVCILCVTVRRILLILVNVGISSFIFLPVVQKRILTYYHRVQYLKVCCLNVSFVQLKFDMHIDFGEYRIYNSFTGVQNKILMHYGLWSQKYASV